MHIQLSGTPLLDWEPPVKTKKVSNISVSFCFSNALRMLYKQLSAHQIMTTPVVVFKEKEKVGNIIDALHNTEHHGFPVVDMNETTETDNDQQQQPHFGLLKAYLLNYLLAHLLSFYFSK